MKQKRIYDRDFKETAVQLSMQRDNLGLLANELGISKKLLYCRVLQLSRSSYYQWKKHPVGKRKLRSNELDKRIQGTYYQA